MKHKLFILFIFFVLNACAQSTALIGPAITIGTTGNVVQAGLTYGSNVAVKDATGKLPGEHVSLYLENKKEEKKVKKDTIAYLDNHIKEMRNKLSIKK